jgi:predicted RNA-binding Zn ribbon-like protein
MKIQEFSGNRDIPESLAIIEAIVNTRYGRTHPDEWATPTQLQEWLQQHQLLGHEAALTRGDQRRMIEMREALRGLLRANNGMSLATEHIETLNHIARHAPMVVHFRQDGLTDLAPEIEGIDGVVSIVCARVYTAMIDGTWARLKVCRNEPCQKAFYDSSKNHSGAWCSMARCGSRLKARTYRQRQHKQGDKEPNIQV